jgi:uncharacterized protein YijF (DUF1287 family)
MPFIMRSVLLLSLLVFAGCRASSQSTQSWRSRNAAQKSSSNAAKIVAAARAQVGTVYDQSYYSLSYPGGDVPKGRGACTDVIIRALRATGRDLQKLMHEDMKRNFALYPSRKRWGLTRTDKNIDHRRVPNQMVFYRRFGQELTRDTSAKNRAAWQPGDIVCWDLNGNGMTHTGIVSDRNNVRDWPLVIHNIGGCREEDALTAWKIIGHFRYPK